MEKKPSALAQIYARLIENGSRTLEEVPAALRPAVEQLMKESEEGKSNE